MSTGNPCRRFASALAKDQSGMIGPAVAAMGVMLVGAAGLALDTGLYYLGNRDLRTATEAAALAAAMDPLQGEARARDYLTRNGYDASVLKSVTVGRYCADAALGSDDRFDPSFNRCPGNGQATAVRIVTGKASRRFLTGVLGSASPIPDLAATATAARIDEAGVGVTSDVLTDVVSPLLTPITTPLVSTLNGLLGSLLGIPISLGKTDIQSLMQGNVSAGLFFDSLASKEGFTGTYGELVSKSHGLKDIAEAAADAASTPETKAALNAFAGQVSNRYSVPFTGLFGLGVWKNMPVGGADEPPALRAGMNAYQLITYAVQSGPTAIDLSTAISQLLPDSTVKIGMVSSGSADRPRFAFGPAGETQVGTSALRIGIQINLGVPPVLAGLASIQVHLPVILDVAAAQAEVTGIDCANTAEQARDTTVTVHARSGLVNAYIGDVSAYDPMAKSMPVMRAADIQQTNIVSISVLGGIVPVNVKGRAIAQPVTGSGPSDATLTFGPGVGSPTQPASPQTIGNKVQIGQTVSDLTTSLLGSDGLDIQIGPLGSLLQLLGLSDITGKVLPTVVKPVTQLIGNTVDPLLTNVLAVLGVQLGTATVWTTGARCGVPVLI